MYMKVMFKKTKRHLLQLEEFGFPVCMLIVK